MKKFKLNKPMVESPTQPNNPNVLWVDVDESTGKLKSIKEYNKGNWELQLSDTSTSDTPTTPTSTLDIPNNEIWYQANTKFELPSEEGEIKEMFGANIKEHYYNTYKDMYVIVFDAPCTKFGFEGDYGMYVYSLHLPGTIKNVILKNMPSIYALYLNEGTESITTDFSIGYVEAPQTLNTVTTVYNSEIGGFIDLCYTLLYKGDVSPHLDTFYARTIIDNENIYVQSRYSKDKKLKIWCGKDIPDNEIWYITYNNSLATLDFPKSDESSLGAKIMSHTYENGKGVIVCDKPITVSTLSIFDANEICALGIPKLADNSNNAQNPTVLVIKSGGHNMSIMSKSISMDYIEAPYVPSNIINGTTCVITGDDSAHLTWTLGHAGAGYTAFVPEDRVFHYKHNFHGSYAIKTLPSKYI